jgi:hypothetical protein
MNPLYIAMIAYGSAGLVLSGLFLLGSLSVLRVPEAHAGLPLLLLFFVLLWPLMIYLVFQRAEWNSYARYVSLIEFTPGDGAWLGTANGVRLPLGDALDTLYERRLGKQLAPDLALFNGYGQVYVSGRMSHYGDRPDGGGPFPIVEMVITTSHEGYWLVDVAGNVYNFGDAYPLKGLGSERATYGVEPLHYRASPVELSQQRPAVALVAPTPEPTPAASEEPGDASTEEADDREPASTEEADSREPASSLAV